MEIFGTEDLSSKCAGVRGVLSPSVRGVLSPSVRGVLSPGGSGVLSPGVHGVLSPDGSGVLSPSDHGVLSPGGMAPWWHLLLGCFDTHIYTVPQEKFYAVI